MSICHATGGYPDALRNCVLVIRGVLQELEARPLDGRWIDSPIGKSRLIALAIMIASLLAMALIASSGSGSAPATLF